MKSAPTPFRKSRVASRTCGIVNTPIAHVMGALLSLLPKRASCLRLPPPARRPFRVLPAVPPEIGAKGVLSKPGSLFVYYEVGEPFPSGSRPT